MGKAEEEPCIHRPLGAKCRTAISYIGANCKSAVHRSVGIRMAETAAMASDAAKKTSGTQQKPNCRDTFRSNRSLPCVETDAVKPLDCNSALASAGMTNTNSGAETRLCSAHVKIALRRIPTGSEVVVSDTWIRHLPRGLPSAGYFTLEGARGL